MDHPERKKKWDEFNVPRPPEKPRKKWKDHLVALIGGSALAAVAGGVAGGFFGFMIAGDTEHHSSNVDPQTYQEVWWLIGACAVLGAILCVGGWIYLWFESME